MKIAVIAAQGRSGRAFVQEALAAGHTVRAGIRGVSPFEPHINLTAVECDATDVNQVTTLVERSDAVVSLIGHVKGSSDFVQTDAMRALVMAMETAGVTRLVSLTGIGVGTNSEAKKKFIKGLARLTTKLGVKRLQDGLAHAEVLAASNLDYTVLKVLLLKDGEPGKFHVKAHGIVKAPTPRREVARAILKILEQNTFVRGYPVITR